MKKSLLCAAVLASFATASAAANVEMFGMFDQGLSYLHEDLAAGMGGPNAANESQANAGFDGNKVALAGRKNVFTQGTGNVSTIGVRGKEKINDDLTVGLSLGTRPFCRQRRALQPQHFL